LRSYLMERSFNARERRLVEMLDEREEELEELFEPPAGCSPVEFQVRLEEDEELRKQIRERFERGRASGRFPALSEIWSHLSVKERESFFKTWGSQARYFIEGPEDSRVRFRQLQKLLEREVEFSTRYPEAYEILFPRMSGSGLPLPSFGIRLLRHRPLPDARIPQGSIEGDAYSATYLHHKESLLPPADQSFWSVDRDFMRALLLAIHSREEYSERIAPPYCDPDLFDGKEVRRKSAIRITDLRLGMALRTRDLNRILGLALRSLQRPITAERVVEWKHQQIGNSLKANSGSIIDAQSRRTEIAVVSFAAAALLLFLDLDMPGLSEEKPCRLVEQVQKLAALIGRLGESLDSVAGELGALLANRPAGRQRRYKRDSYHALVFWRMGHSLEDIAEWLGITPYSSRTVKGTRNWKKKVLDIIAQGKGVENERYPRAAAIFANHEDSPHIRRKAHRAYRTYLVQTERMPGYYPFGQVGRRIRVNFQTQWGEEIINAYVQLGCCLVRGISVSP
jgi:hypothetical protein